MINPTMFILFLCNFITNGICENIVWYHVRGNLTIHCPLPSDTSHAYVWKKQGKILADVVELKGRYQLNAGGAELAVIGRSVEKDYGNYTCSVGDKTHSIEVRGIARPKLPVNSFVNENKDVTITCTLLGLPYTAVEWTFSSNVKANNGSALTRGRLQVSSQGVEGGDFVLEGAQRSDAGRYWCATKTGLNTSTQLRVKDKYAILWPCLGLGAEALFLLTIIKVCGYFKDRGQRKDSETNLLNIEKPHEAIAAPTVHALEPITTHIPLTEDIENIRHG